MEEKQQRHIIDILFVLALLGIFALSAIFLISIGADIYGKTMNNMENNFDTRTALAYLTEKVRQSDLENQVSIGELDGHPAIIITSGDENNGYRTYLYEHEGFLKELMAKQNVTLGPSAGQNILAISDFELLPVGNNLINCQITISNQQTYDLYIYVHSGGINIEK